MAFCPIIEKGQYPFLAIVNWENTEDRAMVERLFRAYGQKSDEKKPPKDSGPIPWKTIEAYYLIGARTLILIGQAKSPLDIQKISSFFILNSNIEIEIYHVMSAVDLAKIDQVKQLK